MADAKKSLQLIERSTLARPDRRYWGTAPSAGATELRYMYSIGIVDITTFPYQAVAIPGADPARNYKGRGSAWFTFPTPPQSYDISEPAATVITPTQDGGKFIESQGSIFKDIRISGTVGLRPAPISNELIPGLAAKTGVTLEVPQSLSLGQNASFNDDRGLKPAEITGLDDITFLRNIFRGYWDIKKRNNLARKYVMIWMYAKEGEWYIVEPINFQTTRDSSNPMSWTYTIQLKTLYRFDATLPYKKDKLSAFQELESAWKTLGQVARDVTKAINQISAAIEFAVQLPFNIASDFMGNMIGILSSLANLRNIGKTANNIVRQGIRNLISQDEEIRSLADQIAYGDAAGDKRVFGSTKLGFGKVTPTDDAAMSIHKNGMRRAVMLIARSLKRLHATDSLFQGSRQVQVTDYANRYLEDGEPQYSAGSPLDPNNISLPDSAEEVEVTGTIRGMAKLHTGSAENWKLLAMLNDLKYPYISSTRSTGVLQYGDKMLVPKIPDGDDIVNSVDDTLTDSNRESLSPIVKKYGRDLQLVDEGGWGSGEGVADVKVSQRGDLDVIEGVPNVEQGVMIKFGTEQGELAMHPEFGAAFPIGTKLVLGRIQDFAINTRRTFLSDERISDVDRLKVYTSRDRVYVQARASLKGGDLKLPVNFAVRRG